MGKKLERRVVNIPKHRSSASDADGATSIASSLIRVVLLVGILIGLGTAVGMGIFPRYRPPYAPPAQPDMEDVLAMRGQPAIVGALIAESRPDGNEWQTMNLTGSLGPGIDGAIEMTLYEEPAEVLRARFEAEARKSGWVPLEGWQEPSPNMDFYQKDGKVRVVSIEEYPNDLRSVTVFNGAVASRGDAYER